MPCKLHRLMLRKPPCFVLPTSTGHLAMASIHLCSLRKEVRSVSCLLTAETRPSLLNDNAHLHIQTPEVLQAPLDPLFTRSVMACSDPGGQSPSVNLAAAAPAGDSA